VADNQAADLVALTHVILLSMTSTTRNGAAGSHVTAPPAVPRNVALITHANTILHHHITGLRTVGGSGVDLAPLITAIQAGHTQQLTEAEKDQMERRDKDCMSVATMMGVEHCKRLLLYLGVLDESGLAPVWAVLVKAPARDRLSILQGLVEEEYIAMGMQFEI